MARRSGLDTRQRADVETLTEEGAAPAPPEGRSGPHHARPSRRARRRDAGAPGRRKIVVVFLVAAAVAVACTVQAERPLPHLTLHFDAPLKLVIDGRMPALGWPSVGQGAVAVPALGVLRVSGAQTPVPVASVAKMMTAYLVLVAHPLGPGDQGPSVTLTAADENEADADAAAGDTSVPVRAGERLSERQLLDGLMVPSADNLADVLARWVSGSTGAFVAAMNAAAARLEMRETHYDDPVGLDATTVSTAADSLRLATVAMGLPAFAAVVDQHQVVLPLAGAVTNPVPLIGTAGFVGVKSGFTDAAGGCLVLATVRTIAGRRVLVTAAAIGQRGADPLGSAAAAAGALITSVAGPLVSSPLLPAGTVMGSEHASWGASTPLRTSASVRVVVEPGAVVHITGRPLTGGERRSGAVVVSEGGQVVVTDRLSAGSLAGPSWWWRLVHG